jgi:hypothetical protein
MYRPRRYPLRIFPHRAALGQCLNLRSGLWCACFEDFRVHGAIICAAFLEYY